MALHHNNYGSYELAKCIVAGIRAKRLGIAKYLKADVPPFDPGKPDLIEAFKLPPSPDTATAKPLGS